MNIAHHADACDEGSTALPNVERQPLAQQTGEVSPVTRDRLLHLCHASSQPISVILINTQVMQRLLATDPPQTSEALVALTDVLAGAQQAANLLGAIRDALRERPAPRTPPPVAAP